MYRKRELSNLEKQGLIQSYEFTQELSWKVLKDFLESRGVQEIFGSKDAVKEAFKTGLIENGNMWMDMIKSRNISSHTYDESTIEEILDLINKKYFDEFKNFENRMNKMVEREEI